MYRENLVDELTALLGVEVAGRSNGEGPLLWVALHLVAWMIVIGYSNLRASRRLAGFSTWLRGMLRALSVLAVAGLLLWPFALLSWAFYGGCKLAEMFIIELVMVCVFWLIGGLSAVFVGPSKNGVEPEVETKFEIESEVDSAPEE